VLSSSRTLLATVLGCLLLAGACCPPLRSDFSSPETTLATWQTHLCHDEPEGEYRCLSQGMQQAIYGFSGYFPAREQLLRDDPFVAYLLRHMDLPARVVERLQPDDQHMVLVFEHDGRRLSIGFVVETEVCARLADGQEVFGRITGPLSGALVLQGGGQWVVLGSPTLSAAQAATLAGLRLEQQWKIDAIDGLESPE